MKRRIIRIVPLYWFYTIVFALVALLLPQTLATNHLLSSTELFKSLFFIPYLNADGWIKPYFDLGWTLNYEMYFYLVFAAFLFLRLPLLMIAISAFFFVINVLYYEWNVGDGSAIMQFAARDIVFEFVIGAWIGFFYIKGYRLPEKFLYPCYAVCLVLFIIILFPEIVGGIDHYAYKAKTIAALFVICLTMPKTSENQTLPNWVRGIGDSSYTVYLSHPFALGAVTQAFIMLGVVNTVSPWFTFAACVLTSLIGGYIAYLVIEKPLTQTLKKIMIHKNKPKGMPREEAV